MDSPASSGRRRSTARRARCAAGGTPPMHAPDVALPKLVVVVGSQDALVCRREGVGVRQLQQHALAHAGHRLRTQWMGSTMGAGQCVSAPENSSRPWLAVLRSGSRAPWQVGLAPSVASVVAHLGHEVLGGSGRAASHDRALVVGIQLVERLHQRRRHLRGGGGWYARSAGMPATAQAGPAGLQLPTCVAADSRRPPGSPARQQSRP